MNQTATQTPKKRIEYIDVYRFLIGLVGAICVLLLSWLLYTKRKTESKFQSIIELMGKNSLGIYIISEPFLNRIIIKNLPYKQHLGFVAILFETLFILLAAYGVTYLISKKRSCAKLLLGGR